MGEGMICRKVTGSHGALRQSYVLTKVHPEFRLEDSLLRYISTRGAAPALGFTDVLLAGLARDGGLYVPETWPTLSAAEIRALRGLDRKSTRLNSSHSQISYAVFCLKKKKRSTFGSCTNRAR